MYMLDHLAIIIVGNQNVGKTTTLKHFCETYTNRNVSTFKAGFRNDLMPFFDKYRGVKVGAWFFPSSPTEKKEPLEDEFGSLGWTPDFILMAEQLQGAEYANTIRSLRVRNYHVKEFLLDNSNPDTIWHHFDEQDRNLFLIHRTEQIADYMRSFILARV